MNKNFLRIAACTATITTSFAFGAVPKSSSVESLDAQMKDIRTQTPVDTYGATMRNAAPKVDGSGVFITADALFWKAHVGGTDYAFSDNHPAALPPKKGNNKDISFGWDWGLRAGIGFNTSHGDWDLSAVYTYFNADGSDSYNAGVNSSAVPLKSSSVISTAAGDGALRDFAYCKKAHSQFDFNLNSVDLELKRSYFNSKSVAFTPHIGLKGAWLDLDQTTRYSGGDKIDVAPTDEVLGLEVDNVKVNDGNRFSGIGPRAGFHGRATLGNGFSAFGQFAGSFIWGQFNTRHKEVFSADPDRYKVSVSSSMSQFTPNADMQLGLVYDTYLNKKQQHLTISAGYDLQYYFRVSQSLYPDKVRNALLVFAYDRLAQDVSLHGLTLSAKLDF